MAYSSDDERTRGIAQQVNHEDLYGFGGGPTLWDYNVLRKGGGEKVDVRDKTSDKDYSISY